MKRLLCLLALFAFTLCSSKKTNKEIDPNVRNEIRAKIIECISNKDGISEVLKKYLETLKTSDERIPLHFSKVKLESSDREKIRDCKREVFKSRRKKPETSSNL